MKEKKVKCWEVFKCEQKECPVYKSKELRCWLISGTHCRDEIQGKFIEKMEMCLECRVFDENMDVASMEETIRVVNQQFKEFRKIVDEQDRELESLGLEMALGLSESFEMLRKISKGDPTARVAITTENELLAKLESELNQMAKSLEEMVNQTHELAIGLSEHYDALSKIAAGDFTARAPETSENELIAKMGMLINKAASTLTELIEETEATSMELALSLSEVFEVLNKAAEGDLTVRARENSENELLAKLGEVVNQTIVKREQAEKELRDSEVLYHSLVESLPLNVLRKDLEGRFTFANKLFCDTLDRPFEEIIGKTDFDFYPKELAEKYRQDDLRVIETEEVFEDIEEHKKQDGETLYVQVLKTPVYNSKGDVIGTQGIFWDVTDRKQAEEALSKERDLLQTLMDNIPDSIYFKDSKSRFTRINKAQAKILGLDSPEQAVGKTDFDFFEEVHAKEAYEDEQEIIRTGRPLIGKIEQDIYQDRRTRWVSSTKVPIKDETGQVIGLVGISRDITELKNAEEEMQESNRRLEEVLANLDEKNKELESFVYTVSHDLKTPLVSLEGFSSMLLDNYNEELDETAQLYLSRIQANVEKMRDLIQDLLELSRIGRIVDSYESVNVEKIVEELVETLEARLSERGTELVIQENLPTVTCEKVRIKQVFENLISNANKFMGEDNDNPRIEIGFHDRGDFFEFFVKDNGIGIEKEYHEKIFKIFERLEDIDVEGTGVGLTLVKKIVEIHEGEIWIDSKVGKGTIIHFTLPKN